MTESMSNSGACDASPNVVAQPEWSQILGTHEHGDSCDTCRPARHRSVDRGPVKVEPRADVRAACAEMFAIFVGLVDAGFTEGQALGMVETMVQALVLKGGPIAE
jgi:hypothetical protein